MALGDLSTEESGLQKLKYAFGDLNKSERECFASEAASEIDAYENAEFNLLCFAYDFGEQRELDSCVPNNAPTEQTVGEVNKKRKLLNLWHSIEPKIQDQFLMWATREKSIEESA